jgi:hypothetical protein
MSDDQIEWRRTLFVSLHADIQWAKGQSWNAIQWTLILLAALYTGWREYGAVHTGVWAVAVILIAYWSLKWLDSLHTFAQEARDYSERILKDTAVREFLPQRLSEDPNHLFLFYGKFWIIFVAATITFYQICEGCRPGTACNG